MIPAAPRTPGTRGRSSPRRSSSRTAGSSAARRAAAPTARRAGSVVRSTNQAAPTPMTAQIGVAAAATSIECSRSVKVEVDPMAVPATERPPWAACTIVTRTGAATSNAATMHAASSPLGRLDPTRQAERRLTPARTGCARPCRGASPSSLQTRAPRTGVRSRWPRRSQATVCIGSSLSRRPRCTRRSDRRSSAATCAPLWRGSRGRRAIPDDRLGLARPLLRAGIGGHARTR